jgi:hypothetical protein
MASLDKYDIASALAVYRDVQATTYVCTFAANYKDRSVKDMDGYRKTMSGFVQKFEDAAAEVIGRESQTAGLIINRLARAMKRYPRAYTHGIPIELPDDILDQIEKSFLDLGLADTGQRG